MLIYFHRQLTRMNKSIIFLVASKPILNTDKTQIFENLSSYSTVYLNSLLYSNWVELLSRLDVNSDIYFCLENQDKDSIPRNFLPDTNKLLLLDPASVNNLPDIYGSLHLPDYSNFLFIYFNSIGITLQDLYRVFDLLTMPDKTFVIGKSVNDQVVFFSSNNLSGEIFKDVITHRGNYHDFLNSIIPEDIYLHTIDSFLSINYFSDFKKLYIELSKKESLSYCSENIHERFNDLFIEYKELLNE